MSENEREIKTWEDVERDAKEHGWVLNPDKKVVENLLKVFNKKKKNQGEFYCPCRVEQVPENICVCVYAEEEVKRDGHCHCRLFYSKEAAQKIKSKSISDFGKL